MTAAAAAPNALLLSVVPLVRLLARRAAGGLRMDPDDVFQELALAVLRAAPRHDPGRGAFTTFTAAVCRRAVARLAERQAGKLRAARFPIGADGRELLPADPRAVDPGEAVAAAEAWMLRRRRLYSALARQTPLERAAVTARFGFGGREPVLRLADIDLARSPATNQATYAWAMTKLEDALRRPLKLGRRLKKLRRQRERLTGAG